MADKPRIDISEAFGIVGTAASGAGAALSDAPSTTAAAPLAALGALGGIDLTGVAVGAGIGAGVAWVSGSRPLTGAAVGGLAAVVLPMLGITPIAIGPGGV